MLTMDLKRDRVPFQIANTESEKNIVRKIKQYFMVGRSFYLERHCNFVRFPFLR